MNALIVGASPSTEIARIVSEIAHRFDLVIAADGGARYVTQADLDPDVVVGDADSLSPANLQALEERGVVVERHAREKDQTDLDLAIAAARARGVTHVTVVGATGGRLDHTLATLGTLMGAADLSPELVDAGLHGWVLDAQGRSSAAIDVCEGVVSIISLTDRSRVSADGLAWPLVDLVLERLSSHGISNRIVSSGAQVRVGEGVVLVVCVRDDSAIHTS